MAAPPSKRLTVPCTRSPFLAAYSLKTALLSSSRMFWIMHLLGGLGGDAAEFVRRKHLLALLGGDVAGCRGRW